MGVGRISSNDIRSPKTVLPHNNIIKDKEIIMAWLGVLIFLIFVLFNVGVFLLRNKPQISYAVAYTIAIYLLVYKICEYIYYQAVGLHMKFPVEFSALSYFLLSISVVFRIKKMDQFGAFAGMLAGLMYSVSFWISPMSFVNSMDTPFLFVMAIINHHSLYFAGALLLFNVRKYDYKDCWIMFLGIGAMVAYSWIIYLFTPYSSLYGKPTIIQICDGTILDWLGASSIPTWGYALYIVLAVILLLGLLAGFYAANRLETKRRIKKGVAEDYFPEKWIDTYRLKTETAKEPE